MPARPPGTFVTVGGLTNRVSDKAGGGPLQHPSVASASRVQLRSAGTYRFKYVTAMILPPADIWCLPDGR